MSCLRCFLLPDCLCYFIFAFPWRALGYMTLMMMKLNQERKGFFLSLPKLGREVKISFFQERSRRCNLDSRPLWEQFCWSIGHPVPTPKITTSPWKNFLLLHLRAGAQRSFIDMYCPFLAGMSALCNTNSNSREAKAALSFLQPLGNQLSGSWRMPCHIICAGVTG